MDEEYDEINLTALFKAVVKQAARDAFLAQNISNKNKNDALDFLMGGMDLELVCDLADVDYQKICEVMKNPSKNNNENYIKIENEIK